MPIYEYVCRACGREFEVLVGRDSTPACPGCDGQNLQRKLSVFAVSSPQERAATPQPGPCAECPGARAAGSCPWGGT